MDVNPLCRVNEKVVFVREANEEKDHLNVLGRVGKQTVTHMHRATATFTSPDTRISVPMILSPRTVNLQNCRKPDSPCRSLKILRSLLEAKACWWCLFTVMRGAATVAPATGSTKT